MKKFEKFVDLTRTILALILWLAVFSSFASGSFTNIVIFSWFPLIIHQIIGWIGIITAVLFAVAEFFGWKIL